MLVKNPQLVYVRRVDDGATPLHLAQNAAVAAALIENGADIEAMDNSTRSTPLHWALDRELFEKKSDTAAYLMDQGAKADDFLCLCALGDLDRIKAQVAKDPSLANYGPHPDDQLGPTALHVAVEYGHLELVRFLVDHGANVNSMREVSPLHFAAWFNRIEIATFLLEHGAKLMALDTNYHETPMGWAIYRGQPEMVRFLLARGTKVTATDRNNAISGEHGKNGPPCGTPEDYRKIQELLKTASSRPSE